MPTNEEKSWLQLKQQLLKDPGPSDLYSEIKAFFTPIREMLDYHPTTHSNELHSQERRH